MLWKSNLPACLVLAIVLKANAPSIAGPICPRPKLTLSERIEQSDVAVLARFVGSVEKTEKSSGSAVYELREILRNRKEHVRSGDRLVRPQESDAESGDAFLLTGVQDGREFEWAPPVKISVEGISYLQHIPRKDVPTAERLPYFLKFLESSDPIVSVDAYSEFSEADYEEVAKLADRFSREKLRKWITDPQTPPVRIGLYGKMIGLCGNASDAEILRRQIVIKPEKFRIGIDGVMFGYLQLTGVDGLELIDRTKLKATDLPFSEMYQAMQALRHMWDHGNSGISKKRLLQSMRLIVDQPMLSDLAIHDLARWKDWGMQDHLMSIYGVGEFAEPTIKRAIVRYMLKSSQDIPPNADPDDESKLPAHVVQGRRCIRQLDKKDPETIRQAKRFFVFN